MMQLTGSGEHLSSEFWSTPDNRSPASHAVLPLMLQPAFSVERQSRRQIYGEAERLNQRQLQHESTHRRVCVFQTDVFEQILSDDQIVCSVCMKTKRTATIILHLKTLFC